jgi:hypothetical protein
MDPRGAWDRRLAARAVAIAAIAATVTLVIVAATDDGAPWPRRLAMWAALAPVAGALGSAGAIRIARSRGEARALLALGVEPSRLALGAVLGGVALALLGAALAASGWADLAALFPRPAVARVWAPDGAGGMREATLGILVGPGGAISRTGVDPSGLAGLPPNAGLAAVIAVGLGALGAPPWASLELPRLRKLVVALISVVALIIGFQAVAAGRTTPLVLVLSPMALLIEIGIAWARRRASRHARFGGLVAPLRPPPGDRAPEEKGREP